MSPYVRLAIYLRVMESMMIALSVVHMNGGGNVRHGMLPFTFFAPYTPFQLTILYARAVRLTMGGILGWYFL